MKKNEEVIIPIRPNEENVKHPIIPLVIENQPLGIRFDTPCAYCTKADDCNHSMCYHKHKVHAGEFIPYGEWFSRFIPKVASKPIEYLFCDAYEGEMSKYASFFGYLLSDANKGMVSDDQRKAILELMCKKDFNLSEDGFEYQFSTWIIPPVVPEPEKVTLKDKLKRIFIVHNK